MSDSYEYYDVINRSPDAALAGVTNLSGYLYSNNAPEKVWIDFFLQIYFRELLIVDAYQFTNDDLQNPYMEQLVPVYRSCTEEELQLVGGGWKYGTFVSTLLTQPSFYLPWAQKRCVNNRKSQKYTKLKITK